MNYKSASLNLERSLWAPGFTKPCPLSCLQACPQLSATQAVPSAAANLSESPRPATNPQTYHKPPNLPQTPHTHCCQTHTAAQRTNNRENKSLHAVLLEFHIGFPVPLQLPQVQRLQLWQRHPLCLITRVLPGIQNEQ